MGNKKANVRPKAFISYSWTSPAHEAWVLELANELTELGIEVIIDKWYLREGADKYAFMEQMITNSDVQKVIVVCDKLYVEKADGRKGGVGTETQILTPALYNQIDPVDQKQKFVAVVTEKDQRGKAYLPTYLKGRIYIDMSDQDKRAENVEPLVRWIYDKPTHKPPELGRPPAYIEVDDTVSLGTSSRQREAMMSVTQNRPTTIGALRDYFETFTKNLEKFRIIKRDGKEFDDQVIESIEAFLPYRDEVTTLFVSIAKHCSDYEAYETIGEFLEQLLPYGFCPPNSTFWSDENADNFKFILYELFLYAVAALLKYGRFAQLDRLIKRDYFFPHGSPRGPEGGLVPFTFFRSYVQSLQHRNDRLNQRRLSPIADLIHERAVHSALRFEDIMQAEFILFIRDELRQREDFYPDACWYPNTLLYATFSSRSRAPFQVFARAQSNHYFEQIRVVLGGASKDHLVKLIEDYAAGQRSLPQWEAHTFDPSALLGLNKLATRP